MLDEAIVKALLRQTEQLKRIADALEESLYI